MNEIQLRKICEISLLTFVSIFMIFGYGCNKKKSQDQQATSSYITIPVMENETPIIAVYVDDFGISRNKPIWRNIILLVFPNGEIVWSKDQLKGGSPYFRGKTSPQIIKRFFEVLDEKKIFQSPSKYINNFGPDSSFVNIVVIRGSDYIDIKSWHELYEADTNLVATSHGLESLDGRNRQEVLSQQPENYKEFRQTWDKIRQYSKMLIPSEGQPAGGLYFDFKHITLGQ